MSAAIQDKDSLTLDDPLLNRHIHALIPPATPRPPTSDGHYSGAQDSGRAGRAMAGNSSVPHCQQRPRPMPDVLRRVRCHRDSPLPGNSYKPRHTYRFTTGTPAGLHFQQWSQPGTCVLRRDKSVRPRSRPRPCLPRRGGSPNAGLWLLLHCD